MLDRRRSLVYRNALVLVLASGLFFPSMGARHPADSHWVPVDKHAEGPLTIEAERAIFRGPEMHLQVELLDAPRRALFLKSAGIETADPFHKDLLGWRVFTFLVRLQNTSDQPLLLQPPSFFFITKRPVSYTTPCDLDCILTAADRAGLDRNGTRKLQQAVLDPSETIRPGGRLSKLLVYVHIPEEFKQFVLDMDGISVGSEQLRFIVPYNVMPEEKKKKSSPKETQQARKESP